MVSIFNLYFFLIEFVLHKGQTLPFKVIFQKWSILGLVVCHHKKGCPPSYHQRLHWATRASSRNQGQRTIYKKVICPPLRTPWPHQGYQGHCQVQASVATTFSTPHQPITCKQVSKCHHMCVGAFIMPSNHIKCKQWASWPLQGHQRLHQGFQVFMGFFIKQGASKASLNTSTTLGDP